MPAEAIVAAVAAAVVILMALRAWGYKRRKDEERAYRSRMRPGDEVILSSGIHATIVSLDKVTAVVRIAPDVEVTVERYALAALLSDLGPDRGGPKEGAKKEDER